MPHIQAERDCRRKSERVIWPTKLGYIRTAASLSTLFSTEELNALADQWTANLRAGIGETGTDTVFSRSFSALCLASLAKRELHAPFLGGERYRTLLERALQYLGGEVTRVVSTQPMDGCTRRHTQQTSWRISRTIRDSQKMIKPMS